MTESLASHISRRKEGRALLTGHLLVTINCADSIALLLDSGPSLHSIVNPEEFIHHAHTAAWCAAHRDAGEWEH